MDLSKLPGLIEDFMKNSSIIGSIVPDGTHAHSLKSIVLLVNAIPVVAVLPADERLCFEKLAAYLATTTERICLAPRADVVKLCGFPVGAVPPFGHSPALRVLVDAAGRSGAVAGGCGNPLLEVMTSWEAILTAPGCEEASVVSR
eukprot:TRINITY_DN49014_c0_g2_i2.p1 TRINITY_DN49014_c0_g2~~TRINITY_DN49014_c0_g2_i2.p1  ORF type:complete len:145 (-),score=14.35 TRINITY_DN49014_c0_g2_i2:227-661(-)